MEEFTALGLPVPPPSTPSFPMVLIGLVAIQNKENKKWCSTHETRGWYMPAGRVDFGEGIETGAKREALEEAGVDVDLTNLIRIDFSPTKLGTRFRSIYQADLKDENQKLRDKSMADNEIIEACWVEPSELEDGRKVRTLEMVEIFQFIDRTENTRRVPASFIQSIDGSPIDHNIVKTNTIYSITLVIFDKDFNNIAVSESEENGFIHSFMKTPVQFVTFAKQHPIMSNSKNAEILGLVRMRYAPPHDLYKEREVGHMNVVIAARVSSFSSNIKTIPTNSILENTVPFNKVDVELLDKIVNHQHVYPVHLISPEGSPLSPYTQVSQQNTESNDKKCKIM